MLTNNQIIHRQYLQSGVWRAKRLEAMAHYGATCARCGGLGSDVHHKNYDRVGGFELMEDLEVLCRDCHESWHLSAQLGRARKRRYRAINQLAIYRKLNASQRRLLVAQFRLQSDQILYLKLGFENPESKVVQAACKILGVDGCYPPKKHVQRFKPIRRRQRY